MGCDCSQLSPEGVFGQLRLGLRIYVKYTQLNVYPLLLFAGKMEETAKFFLFVVEGIDNYSCE